MEYVHKFVAAFNRWDSVPVRTPVEKATKLAQGWVTEMPVIEVPAPAEATGDPVSDVIASIMDNAPDAPKKRGRPRKDDAE